MVFYIAQKYSFLISSPLPPSPKYFYFEKFNDLAEFESRRFKKVIKGVQKLAEVALPESSSERGVRTISGKKGLEVWIRTGALLALRI